MLTGQKKECATNLPIFLGGKEIVENHVDYVRALNMDLQPGAEVSNKKTIQIKATAAKVCLHTAKNTLCIQLLKLGHFERANLILRMLLAT